MENLSANLCQICEKGKFKYNCPKCNIFYCSVKCYKSREHLQCSESFYKECIEEEQKLHLNSNSKDGNKDISEILHRVIDGDFVPDPNDIEEVDSDDEIDDDDLAERIKDIDLNDADKLWNILSKEEKAEFQNLIENNEIIKLVPEFEPWWLTSLTKEPIIKELDECLENTTSNIPPIKENILNFNSITQKAPHPNLKYSLLNLYGAYAYTVRFFAGDHLSNFFEASHFLWMLSGVLKKNLTYQSYEESLQDLLLQSQNEGIMIDQDEFEIIMSDVEIISHGPDESGPDAYKLAVLTEIQNLFINLKKNRQKSDEKPNRNTFSNMFSNIKQSDELKKTELSQIIKKLDFFLSYLHSKKYLSDINE